MKSPPSTPKDYCLDAILSYFNSGAPKSPQIYLARGAMLRAWALSDDLKEIAVLAIGRERGIQRAVVLESSEYSGQISGSINSYETLRLQHLSCNPSVYVVDELVSEVKSASNRKIAAWVIKLAHDELSKDSSISDGTSEESYSRRIALLSQALKSPPIRAVLGEPGGHFRPGGAAARDARGSRLQLHRKASEALRTYDGLNRLAPFALRRVVSNSLLDRMGNQRLIELAAGLALAEGLSIATGYPFEWNGRVAETGLIGSVGHFTVGWRSAIALEGEAAPSTITAVDTQTGNAATFIRCAEVTSQDAEDETIRLTTDALLQECRRDSRRNSDRQELPLSRCALVMRRFHRFAPPPSQRERLLIVDFDGFVWGKFLELGRRLAGLSHRTS